MPISEETEGVEENDEIDDLVGELVSIARNAAFFSKPLKTQAVIWSSFLEGVQLER